MVRTSLNLVPHVHLRLTSLTYVPSDPTPNIWWQTIDRGASGRGKRSRSVRKDHNTMNVRRQVCLWHSIYLWVIDVCCRGGDGNLKMLPPRISTRAPCAGVGTSSIFFGHLIYTRRCLLMSKSLCRATYPHRQAHSGYFDRDVYPPAINWGIELILIGSVPWSRFS
jgi:hypothetical protein